jgi:hypothetical protein
MNCSVDYVFGGDGAELRRLVAQAAGLETQAAAEPEANGPGRDYPRLH